MEPAHKLGKQLSSASACGASAAVILLEDEVRRCEVLVKDLRAGTQRTVQAPWIKGQGAGGEESLLSAVQELRGRSSG